jgi:D,D-heptose 1,7-bisphosphate phosphatase
MIQQVVVLVGGRGTRLGALAHVTPKPLMPINEDRVFLDYLLAHFARHGAANALLLAGHLGEQVEQRYQGQTIRGMGVQVLRELDPAGTGGALRLAEPYLADAFYMTNGDSFFDFNVLALAHALQSGAMGALALRHVDDARRFGAVSLENGIIRAFREKDETLSGGALISGGVYALRKRILDAVPQPPSSIEQDAFPVLAQRGQLRGEVFGGYFIDIGLPDTLAKARSELPALDRRAAVFFDRDGCLNHDAGYTHKVADLRFMEGAKEAVRYVNDAGLLAIVVTNQGGIGKGLFTEADMHAFHAAMQAELAKAGAHIDAFYASPHHPEAIIPTLRADDHPDRKPNPGMILKAISEWRIDKNRSVMIGDQPSDLKAAESAGVAGFLYRSGSLLALVREALDRK